MEVRCFQLADTGRLPNLKELLQSSRDTDKQAWDLVSWILSSKILTIHSAEKAEVRLWGIGSQVPRRGSLRQQHQCSGSEAYPWVAG